MKKLLIIAAILMVVSMMLTMGMPTRPAKADGTVNWTNHGADLLPCNGSMHMIFTPGGNDTVTAATLYINNDGGHPMSKNGNGGSWEVWVNGNFDTNLSMYVSYVGNLGNGSSGVQISECVPTPQPDNVSIDPTITCSWNGEVSLGNVSLTVEHATLAINGVGSYTSSQTIQLPNGTYDYSWTPDTGYTGSGEGSFVVDVSCKPSEPPPPPPVIEQTAPETGGGIPWWMQFLNFFRR